MMRLSTLTRKLPIFIVVGVVVVVLGGLAIVAWIGSGTSPAAVDASNQPTWFNIPFTDARTNKAITLADFRGKTVIVQSMGIGCVPCTEQQHRSATVLPNFSSDQVAYISLDVVPGQDTAQLMTYANENSFPWTFATNTTNLLRTLIQKFGLSVVNIDSVPLFVISPSGKVSQLYTGGLTENELTRLITDQAKN